MEFIVTLAVGACIAAMGISMIVTGNPSLLHSYHYATTPVRELPALARETGAGLTVSGVGCSLLGASALADWLSVVGIALLMGGIVIALAAIVRHNGGLMTFGVGTASTTFAHSCRPGVAMLTGALVGCVLGAPSIVLGVHMALTGDVSSLHSYHYVHVAANDLAAFALGEGMGFVALGIALVVGGVAVGRMAVRPAVRWSKVLLIVAGALFVAGIAGLTIVTVYYNGSLMG